MAGTYHGWAFHESFDGGKAQGALTVGRTGVRFDWGSGTVELPLRGLRIALGGAANRLVFFRHPSLPDWSLYTSDRTVLKHRELTTSAPLQRQLAVIGSTRRLAILIPALLLAIVAGLLLLIYSLRGVFARTVADRIPVEWERKLGDTVYAQYAAEHEFIEDEEIARALAAITDRLREGVHDARFEFDIHVSRDSNVNAFALPGGHVVMNTGLLLRADSAEEVAGVLAHEMAHVTQRHGLRQLIGAAGLYLVVEAVLGDVSGILAVIAQQGPILVALRYSRDHEREADRMAFGYLTGAEIDPLGLARFFDRIHKQTDKDGAPGRAPDGVRKTLTFLSTHPDAGERTEALRTLTVEAGAREWRPIELPYEHFKDTVRQAIRGTEGSMDP